MGRSGLDQTNDFQNICRSALDRIQFSRIQDWTQTEQFHSSLNSAQCRAQDGWCTGRLLDWMPPYQNLVLSSGVWWSLLLHIRCLWRHNMTSYSRVQPNVMAKFVGTSCILFYTHSPYSLLYNVSL